MANTFFTHTCSCVVNGLCINVIAVNVVLENNLYSTLEKSFDHRHSEHQPFKYICQKTMDNLQEYNYVA